MEWYDELTCFKKSDSCYDCKREKTMDSQPRCSRFKSTCSGSCAQSHGEDCTLSFPDCLLKEELHNWFNLILEERVKIFKHNSENLMKIGWKVRKLWHFEVSQICTKYFLTSRYEYANDWVDDVITSLLAIYFIHNILKMLIFCPNLW